MGPAAQPVEVTDLVTDLQVLTDRFDPDAIELADVRDVMTDLGQAKRLVEGMVLLLARRLEDLPPSSTRGRDSGAADELAKATGTSTSQARRQLSTSKRLSLQGGVAHKVRAGELSGEQAEAVTDAVEADPDAEGKLLAAAREQTVNDLKRTCRDRKAAADPNPDATRLRHHHRRSFRSWTESDGEWKSILSAPADMGARMEAALRGEHDDTFRAASAAGRHEPDAAYRFDALLTLLERGAAGGRGTEREDDHAARSPDRAADDDGPGEGGPDDRPEGLEPDDTPGSSGTAAAAPARRSGRQTKAIVLVDAEALRRGRLEPGDTCEIAGIGRVSLSAVKSLIPDAHIAYVIRDAVDASVTHLGRQATAHQRTALEARGYECEVPGCRAAHLLEIDHVRDWAFSRQTKLGDLAWLCRHHHDQKSRRGHHLTGPPGRRTWHAPDGRVLSSDRSDDEPHPLDPPQGRPIEILRHAGKATPSCASRRRRTIRANGWRIDTETAEADGSGQDRSRPCDDRDARQSAQDGGPSP